MKLDMSPRPQLMDEGIVFRTPSESRSGLYHYTIKLRHGGVICSCEAWSFRGHCKHAEQVPLDSPAATKIIAEWRKREPTT